MTHSKILSLGGLSKLDVCISTGKTAHAATAHSSGASVVLHALADEVGPNYLGSGFQSIAPEFSCFRIRF